MKIKEKIKKIRIKSYSEYSKAELKKEQKYLQTMILFSIVCFIFVLMIAYNQIIFPILILFFITLFIIINLVDHVNVQLYLKFMEINEKINNMQKEIDDLYVIALKEDDPL